MVLTIHEDIMMRIWNVSMVTLVSFCAINAVFATTFNGITELTGKTFDDLTINGPATLTDIKAQTLNIHGPFDFKKIDVTKSSDVSGPMRGEEGHFANLSVTGSLEAEKITTETLSVIGPATLKYFTVKGHADIKGPLVSQKGHLQDVTYMSKGDLTDTTVKNIVVKHNNAHADKHEKDVLELKGTTAVTGDITFESGQGEIITEGKDISISGKIKGGVLKANTK